MVITLPQIHRISAGDERVASIDLTDELDSSVTLTGTPTVTEVTTTDLTISNVAINTVALTVLNETVAIGKGVQFKVKGQVAKKTYRVRILATTNGTPDEKINRDILIICVE